jgi:anti-sigma factor RsiW
VTSGHLGPAVLAEYDEGLLADRQAAQVRAHLAECDACSVLRAQIGALPERLRTAPKELPVPGHVVRQIDEALAAERDRMAEPAQAGRPNVVRLGRLRPLLRHAPQLLGAAALVGAIAFVGSVVLGGSDDGSDEGALSSADAPEATSGDVAGGADVPASEDLSQSDNARLDEQIRAVAGLVLASQRGGLPTPDSVGPESAQDDARAQLSSGCGAALAREVGRDRLGAAPTDVGGGGNVLVVVAGAGPGSAQGWVVPGCDASTDDAVAERTVRLE